MGSENEAEQSFGRPCRGAALRLTRNSADAEDLVSEALTKAWAAFPQLADRQAFPKWVFRILSNTFISERRRAPSAA